MRATTLRRVRPWVQILTFLLFLYLLFRAGQTGFLSSDLFFRFDPLVGIANMVAARQVAPALLAGALIALAAAVVLGRAWCGWICPLGA